MPLFIASLQYLENQIFPYWLPHLIYVPEHLFVSTVLWYLVTLITVLPWLKWSATLVWISWLEGKRVLALQNHTVSFQQECPHSPSWHWYHSDLACSDMENADDTGFSVSHKSLVFTHLPWYIFNHYKCLIHMNSNHHGMINISYKYSLTAEIKYSKYTWFVRSIITD